MSARGLDSTPSALPLLLALGAGSGCAALIYQVVWFQLLALVLGASAVSLGVLLATFMGGMCIGSFAFARCVGTGRHPLRALAAVELGIGLCGFCVLLALPVIGTVYAALADTGSTSGPARLLLRAVIAALLLLPPTILMGATLPAVARALPSAPQRASRIGLCYAGNVLGAVAGSLLAGFYLLRAHDVGVATFVAVGLNLGIAAVAWLAARRYPPAAPCIATESVPSRTAPRSMHVVVALSGATALAAEVVWTRQLSLLLGGTVYTFALVLAGVLLGIGLGSLLGAVVPRRAARPALGLCQLGLCLAIAWSAYALARSLPYWPLDVTLPAAPGVMAQLDLIRVLWVVGPATLVWGSSLPLAVTVASEHEADAGRLAGGLYAANTLGAIVGALGTGFVLLIAFGSRHVAQLLMLVALCAGWIVLASSVRESTAAGRRRSIVAVGMTLGGVLAIFAVPVVPDALVAYGRFMPTRGTDVNVIYRGEGLTGSIAVSEETDGTRIYHNAGKAQASTYPRDMRLQRLLGHLTTLVPENGRRYLVIGLGSGITAGAVSIDPAAERVVVADIEQLTREVAGRFFRESNYGVVDSPKVDLRIDDGRHYLLTTAETFDGITSDPLDPWVKGAAALYTREFWQLVESRLNPGGVVTVFVQLYETTEAGVKSELATFFEVFPNGAVFANTVRGAGYDAVLLGRRGATPIDADRILARLREPTYARVVASLREVGFRNAADLLGTFAARAADLAPWLEDAAINTDRNLRLQYLAGDGFNVYRADQIYRAMTSGFVPAPGDYLDASPGLLREIEQAIRLRQSRY